MVLKLAAKESINHIILVCRVPVFLYKHVEEEVYVRQPKGFEVKEDFVQVEKRFVWAQANS